MFPVAKAGGGEVEADAAAAAASRRWRAAREAEVMRGTVGRCAAGDDVATGMGAQGCVCVR
eukprot:scaffold207432_cov14-Tisochrysis_lutea.AAC.1